MRVSIRPLEVDDAKTSYLWRNNPEIWRFTGFRPDIIVTEKIEIEWIKRVINEKDSARFAILIHVKSQSKYVGNVQLTNISNGTAQYHIFIGDTDYWGKGVAREATRLILDHGFSKLELNSIWLEVRNTHKAAIHLYNKCNFHAISSLGNTVRMEILRNV